ncbi:helix-turn-helix domain-containing protein [Pseudonocardia sp. 73-21]|uniref:helix-turn-helix domain-containing protein n=1 Tax=Pseudonocardia sp. 73-21 TaxID=1895809 RepID=UPI00095E64AA|nr:helix-turn-helix domain-containing protein [Pseudonocardia sp. 73-21]OJY53535.1 MAG: hypothetical protein BGP03_17525 [Pseudonocardia sp. 73-21]
MTDHSDAVIVPQDAVLLSGAACAALIPALASPTVRAQLSALGGQTSSVILSRGRAWLASSSAGSESGSSLSAPGPTGRDLDHDIDTAEAAELLGCSTRWVRMLADRGDLPGRYCGRGWTFHRADVVDYPHRRRG